MKFTIENILLYVIFIFLTHVPDLSSAIQCYQCSHTIPMFFKPTDILRLCSEFDYSKKFIVDCPHSTFCKKKTFTTKLRVPIYGMERDCAFQSYDTHIYSNEKRLWEPAVIIEEPYKEACVSEDKIEGLRTTDVKYCYCKGNLCNSGGDWKNSAYLILLSVIILIVYNNNCMFVFIV